VLQLRDVDTYYGNIRALHGVSLDVPEGAIVAIIGPNGSGKSTTVRTVSALSPARAGTISFRGKAIERLRPDQIVRLGIAHVPQGRQLFLGLSVRENLAMGAYIRSDSEAVKSDVDRVLEMFPVLRERSGQQAATLSGGEQQMLAIARALLARPALLLLDEPSIGLAPAMVDRVFERINAIRAQGVTVVVVEQNVAAALAVADTVYVMESGRVALTGNAQALLADDSIRRVFLGAGVPAGNEGDPSVPSLRT